MFKIKTSPHVTLNDIHLGLSNDNDIYLIQIPDLVIKLGPVVNGQYAYTIITSNYKAFTWILARDVKVFRGKYEKETLEYLNNNGYNWFWNKPRKVYQEDDCLYPPM